ncbi:hypothetical protein JW960_29580 [candidate division KSB1 bacterium]|nr:hypothetical protein [candidate division KSB1 bacterium]
MFLNLNKTMIGFIICIAVIGMMLGCEQFLPDKYDEVTNTPSQLDDSACSILSDTTAVATEITPSLLVNLAGAAATDTDPATINQIFDTQIASIAVLEAKTLLHVVPPSGADTSFAVYQHTGGAATVYFFITWEFTPDNIDEFVEVDLIQRDAKYKTQKLTVPIESVSSCTEHVVFESTGWEDIVPRVRTRCGFAVEQGTYLVRFIVSEPEQLTSFNTALLVE